MLWVQHSHSGLCSNDARTSLPDLTGRGKKRIKVVFTVNWSTKQPSHTNDKQQGCRTERSISSQCIQGHVDYSTHFHVSGHSVCFINILRTFHWLELVLCFSSESRTYWQQLSTIWPLVNWINWSQPLAKVSNSAAFKCLMLGSFPKCKKISID